MDFVQLKAKTFLKVAGIINQKVLYINKDKKEYYSVDLFVNGHKTLLNIKLPDNYPFDKIIEGALLELNVVYSEYQGRAFLNATV